MKAYPQKSRILLPLIVLAAVFAVLLLPAPCSSAQEADRNAVQSSVLTVQPSAAENFDVLLNMLDHQPALQQVDMYECKLTEAQMEVLSKRYPHITFGWTLHIGDHTLRTDATAFSTLHNNKSTGHTSEDFAVLRYCKNLLALDAGHNAISDLSFLEALPKLRILILGRNRITDTTPIGTLRDLEYLELFSDGVKDISALSNCTKLIDLNISNNSIRDLSPVLGLPSIQRLWIFRSTGILPGDRFSREETHAILDSVPKTCTVNFTSDGTGGGWREHARYETIRDIFSSGVYKPWGVYKTLQTGDKGDDVLRLKQRLQALGFFCETAVLSDRYNAATANKIKQCQSMLGEEATGIATPALQTLLFSDGFALPVSTPVPEESWFASNGAEYRTLQYGSEDDDVLRLKKRLQALGYYTARAEFSSYYNATLKDKIQLYQSAVGEEVSGIAGPELQARMFSSDEGSMVNTPQTPAQPAFQSDSFSRFMSSSNGVRPTDSDIMIIDGVAYRTLSLGCSGDDVLCFKRRLQALVIIPKRLSLMINTIKRWISG